TGYVLLCDAPMAAGGCGKANNFAGLSDIVGRGTLAAANNAAAFFLWSDPTFPGDTLKSFFNVDSVDKLSAPLRMVEVTVKPQDLRTYFGYSLKDYPNGNIVVVTATDPVAAAGGAPEPGTVMPAAIALVGMGLALYRKHRAEAN